MKATWKRVGLSMDAVSADGRYKAVWRGRLGWYVYEGKKVVSAGGIRNADGSYVYTHGFKS